MQDHFSIDTTPCDQITFQPPSAYGRMVPFAPVNGSYNWTKREYF